jgi:hypothetical protein
VDQRRFDRLTAAFSSETGRRGAVAGIAAGTAAVFSRGLSASAKKRKKCTNCPQRTCCSCRSAPQGAATKCITFEGITDQNDAQDLCLDFCGSLDLLFKFTFQVPTVANFCAADFDCTVKKCPVKVKG